MFTANSEYGSGRFQMSMIECDAVSHSPDIGKIQGLLLGSAMTAFLWIAVIAIGVESL